MSKANADKVVAAIKGSKGEIISVLVCLLEEEPDEEADAENRHNFAMCCIQDPKMPSPTTIPSSMVTRSCSRLWRSGDESMSSSTMREPVITTAE